VEGEGYMKTKQTFAVGYCKIFYMDKITISIYKLLKNYKT